MQHINKKIVYAIPLILGLIVRIFAYFEWLASPFHYYHTIVGLDMRKFLVSGVNFSDGNAIFTPYNLFITTIYQCVGNDILPEGIVIGQIILGLGTIFFTTYIAMHLLGNKFIALISGIFIALYAPIIIYETTILKTTIYLFLSTLSLALLLYSRKKKFNIFSNSCLAISIILPFTIRFGGLLWIILATSWLFLYILKSKKIQSSTIIIRYLSAFIASLILIIGINQYNNINSKKYISRNFSYIFSTGSNANNEISGRTTNTQPTTVNNSEQSANSAKSANKFIVYFSKLKYLFFTSEMPNNINYYFMKEKLPFIRYLMGPILLIPLAILGFIIMVSRGGFLKKESILFIYIAAFATPTLLFLPLSRYKLSLIPIFSIGAGYALYNILLLTPTFQNFINSHKSNQSAPLEKKKIDKNVWILILYLILLLFAFISNPRIIRSSDKKAYGIGASYIPRKLMEQGKFKDAASILKNYYLNNQDNQIISLNYASALLGSGNPKAAEIVLTSINSPIDINNGAQFYFDLGEALRLQGRKNDALKCYQMAKKYPMTEKRKLFFGKKK